MALAAHTFGIAQLRPGLSECSATNSKMELLFIFALIRCTAVLRFAEIILLGNHAVDLCENISVGVLPNTKKRLKSEYHLRLWVKILVLTTNREQPKSIFHLLTLKNENKAAKPVFNALSNGTT